MKVCESIVDIKNKVKIDEELIKLLDLLEEVNPCEQRYHIGKKSLLISYNLKLNLFNFIGLFPLKVKTRIVGLPISICERGYFGDIDEVIEMLKSMKGLTIILNGNEDLDSKAKTLSTFIFNNSYRTFNDYIDRLRSPYRRRVNRALSHRNKLIIREFQSHEFTNEHYLLYKSIMKRTENPLEILNMDYFMKYDAKLFEFLDKKTERLLGFIQLKRIDSQLYFFFCGFNREDNEEYDLYYNMLLKIVEEGISLGVDRINFGQTSEESKVKIGCIEEERYLAVYHHNKIINKLLQVLVPYFSYRPYEVKHNVFKEVDTIKSIKEEESP